MTENKVLRQIHHNETVAADLRKDISVKRKRYLPIGLDVEHMKCMVVGGGRIGARKARTLLKYGAEVTVLSPDINERLHEPVEKGEIRWIQAEYSPTYLRNFALVVAATAEPELNIRIGRDADRLNALACVVKPGRFSRFIFPATYVNDDIVIAVHSNGRDCARSRRLRDKIARMVAMRNHPQSQFAVFGFKRTELSPYLFNRLTRGIAEIMRESMKNLRTVYLSTCQRWEWYFLADSPMSVVRDLEILLHEKYDVLPESYEPPLYKKYGAGALYHLLCVVCGLDSPIYGETEIVGQVRSALSQGTGINSSDLENIFSSSLQAQNKIRKESGLKPVGKSWSEATTSFLERHIAPLSSRCVSLFGCGRLSKKIALNLVEKGATVFAFSRRTKETGGSWRSQVGLTTHSAGELIKFLSKSDAILLSSDLSDGHIDLVRKYASSGKLVVIDLAGNHRERLHAQSEGWYFGLNDIGSVPLSGEDVKRIAAAKKSALHYAVRLHNSYYPSVRPVRTIRIAGRASRLSLMQIKEALKLLEELLPEANFKTVTMNAPCDIDKITPLSRVRQDDFFTRDIDEALLKEKIDIAIHSAKDLPNRIRDGLYVAAVTPAFAPWECLVTADGKSLTELPREARVGTSCERRRNRLLEFRDDLVACDVRGNVPERIDQLDKGKYDGLILAAAGLVRLGLEHRISQVFTLEKFPPAPGQGSLALVVRESDFELRELLKPLDVNDRKGLLWA